MKRDRGVTHAFVCRPDFTMRPLTRPARPCGTAVLAGVAGADLTYRSVDLILPCGHWGAARRPARLAFFFEI